MQPCTTILGIIEMRQKNISYDDCQSRYDVGSSTVTLIMKRYHEGEIPLEELRKMHAAKVEAIFYPPNNIRRKAENIMPDFAVIHARIMQEGQPVLHVAQIQKRAPYRLNRLLNNSYRLEMNGKNMRTLNPINS